MVSIGARIVLRRTRQGMSQAELAEKARMPQGVLSRLEHDKIKEPGLTVIRNLAYALGVSTDWLLGMSELYEDAEDVAHVS